MVSLAACVMSVHISFPRTPARRCSSADYTYTYSAGWFYDQPECRAMPLYQIVRKLDGSVYIITQFQEKFEAGWPCSQTDTTPETTCNTNLFSLSHPGQPKLTTRASGQCVCESPCAASAPCAAAQPHLASPSPLVHTRRPERVVRCHRRRTKTIFPVCGLSGRRPHMQP